MKTALVTGGNRGIGLAIVQGLAALGYKVLLGSRDLAAGEKAAKNLPGSIVPVEVDLSTREALKRQAETIQGENGPVDILVNNAGILEYGNVLKVSDEAFEASLRVNLLGAFDLIRIFVPEMIEREYGRIVNLSSGWGAFSEGMEGPAAYAISKAGLNALTLSLSHQLPKNVKVNAVCPGWVKTRMGGEGAQLTPEQGADTAIWLATLPEEGPNGGYFRRRRRIEW